MEDIPIQKMIFHGISSSMGYPPPPAPVAALPPRLPISSTSCPSCRVAAAPAPQRPATPKWHRWHRHGAGRLRRVTAPAPGRHVLICQNKGSVSAHFYSFVKGIFDIGGKLSVTLQNHMANMIRGKSRK